MPTGGRTALRSTHPTQVVISAHVGDLDSVLSVDVFRRAIDDLVEFFQAQPDAVVCDLHPDYASTRHAERLAARWDVPLLRVQHHHAHVAACMAEHGLAGPGAGVLVGRHRLRPRRHGLGRRGPAVRRRGVPPRGPSAHVRPARRRSRRARAAALGLGRCCSRFSAQRAAEHAAAWFNAGELDDAAVDVGRPGPLAAHQQHGPAVRRRGGHLRAAAGDQFRGPGGDGPGVRRR